MPTTGESSAWPARAACAGWPISLADRSSGPAGRRSIPGLRAANKSRMSRDPGEKLEGEALRTVRILRRLSFGNFFAQFQQQLRNFNFDRTNFGAGAAQAGRERQPGIARDAVKLRRDDRANRSRNKPTDNCGRRSCDTPGNDSDKRRNECNTATGAFPDRPAAWCGRCRAAAGRTSSGPSISSSRRGPERNDV